MEWERVSATNKEAHDTCTLGESEGECKLGLQNRGMSIEGEREREIQNNKPLPLWSMRGEGV